MSTASSSNTVQFNCTSITQGVPNLADEAFTTAVSTAMAGGSALQNYFNAMNDTSAFWTFIADAVAQGYDPFVMGVTSDNQLVMMANSGNMNFRLSYFYNEDSGATAKDGETPIVGTGQIQLGNTTTSASKWTSFALTIAALPVGMVLTKKLFTGCLKPLFKNAATWLKSDSSKVAAKTSSEEAVFTEDVANEVIDETTPILEETGEEAAAVGLEYAAVDWTGALLEVSGMGMLAALPMIAMAVGHPMYATVTVVNQTTIDFTWSISYQASGEAAALPGTDTTVDYSLPKMGLYTDQWGDKTLQPCAYEASFNFINSSDYGSIGLVLNLTPADGTTPAQIVISIPWAGTNTIWVGASGESPAQIYTTYSFPNEQLNMAYSFDTFLVTVAITALSGKNDNGQYAYCVMANIEPLSSAS